LAQTGNDNNESKVEKPKQNDLAATEPSQPQSFSAPDTTTTLANQQSPTAPEKPQEQQQGNQDQEEEEDYYSESPPPEDYTLDQLALDDCGKIGHWSEDESLTTVSEENDVGIKQSSATAQPTQPAQTQDSVDKTSSSVSTSAPPSTRGWEKKSMKPLAPGKSLFVIASASASSSKPLVASSASSAKPTTSSKPFTNQKPAPISKPQTTPQTSQGDTKGATNKKYEFEEGTCVKCHEKESYKGPYCRDCFKALPTCIVENCTMKSGYKNQLCQIHFQDSKQLCQQCNTRFTVHKSGMCKPCFEDLPFCKEDGCPQRTYASNGLCKTHYHEQKVPCSSCQVGYTVNPSGLCGRCYHAENSYNEWNKESTSYKPKHNQTSTTKELHQCANYFQIRGKTTACTNMTHFTFCKDCYNAMT
jgi:hypothetical protein